MKNFKDSQNPKKIVDPWTYLRGSMANSVSYLRIFQKNFFGKTTIRTNPQSKSDTQSFIQSEAWLTLNETISFGSDAFALLFNIFLNAFALAMFVDKKFILAYILSIPVTALLLSKTSKKIESSSQSAQDARANMFSVLGSAWDSITTGDRYNFNLWEKTFNKSIKTAKNEKLNSVIISEVVSDASMLLSLLPILFVIIWVLIEKVNNTTELTVLVATLPRQIQTLQNISSLICYATHWIGFKAKIEGLKKSLIIKDYKNGTIKWEDLTFHLNNKPATGTKSEIFALIENTQKGRLTIRGGNGSGKSTFLNEVKESTKRNCLLIPAHSDLIFENTFCRPLSSGEKMIAILSETEAFANKAVVLLDEWDANLDSSKIQELTLWIEKLAADQLVVEIRHRS